MPLLGIRIASLHAALFLSVGVIMPFWPVWLASKGMTEQQIGFLIAAGIVAKLLANPITGSLADARGSRGKVMLACAVASLFLYALFGVVDGFIDLLILMVLAQGALSTLVPLTENLTTLAVYRHGLEYGKIRLWGSAAFIVSSAIAGFLLQEHGENSLFWLTLGCIVCVIAACTWAPEVETPPVGLRGAGGGMLLLLRRRPFVLMLLAAGLTQSSHALLYAFGSLNWQAAGISGTVIGFLWGLGVAAEIIVFARGRGVLDRIGPVGLILLGAGAASVRWPLMALSDHIAVQVICQLLHAFTFGATHLGAMHFIARTVEPTLSARAQATYSTMSQGILLGIMSFSAGPAYRALGSDAYLITGGVGMIAFILALTLAARVGLHPRREAPATP